MSNRAILFDFDGTLADSIGWFLQALNGAADRYGFRRVDAGEVDALRAAGPREVMRRLRVPAWKLPMIARDLKRRMAAEIRGIGLFPGVSSTLAALDAAGIRLGIVSSNSRANVASVLGPADSARIGHFGCGGSVFGKAAMLRKALKRVGVGPAEALYVGDEVRDHQAARAAGLAFAAVTWGYNHPEALRALDPEMVLASLDELVRLVASPGPGPGSGGGHGLPAGAPDATL